MVNENKPKQGYFEKSAKRWHWKFIAFIITTVISGATAWYFIGSVIWPKKKVDEVIIVITNHRVPVTGAIVSIDNGPSDTTSDNGICRFIEITKGKHQYTISYKQIIRKHNRDVYGNGVFRDSIDIDSPIDAKNQKGIVNKTKIVDSSAQRRDSATKSPNKKIAKLKHQQKFDDMDLLDQNLIARQVPVDTNNGSQELTTINSTKQPVIVQSYADITSAGFDLKGRLLIWTNCSSCFYIAYLFNHIVHNVPQGSEVTNPKIWNSAFDVAAGRYILTIESPTNIYKYEINIEAGKLLYILVPAYAPKG